MPRLSTERHSCATLVAPPAASSLTDLPHQLDMVKETGHAIGVIAFVHDPTSNDVGLLASLPGARTLGLLPYSI